MYLTHPDPENYWVVNIETDGLDPSVVWCVVMRNAHTNELRVYRHDTGYDTLKREVEEHPEWRYITHNGIWFDCPVLDRLLNITLPISTVVDTYILSTLYNAYLPGGHSLDAWGERMEIKKGSHSDWSKLSQEMVDYCIQDTNVTVSLFHKLTARMHSMGYSEQSCFIEHKIMEVIREQRDNGFYFDTSEAIRLHDRITGHQRVLEERIKELFPDTIQQVGSYSYRVRKDGQPVSTYLRHCERYPKVVRTGATYQTYDYVPFNLNSPKQRAEKLISLGWEPQEYSEAGNPKVDEEVLLRVSEDMDEPGIRAIAEWLVDEARHKMIQNWIDNLGQDSCIHGEVMPNGAASRRMRHRHPNTANIPGLEAKYGAECRALWRARPGRVLVGYDASALEMRCFLHVLGAPPDLVKLYLEGDPHQRNADALGCPRRAAKTIFYAFLYGAGNGKLGILSPLSGKKTREKLYETTPGLKEVVDEVQQEWMDNRTRLKLVDGGYNICPGAHSALNYKCQGNGAVVMKLASVLLREKIVAHGWDALKVGDIHDEGQLDVAPACADDVGRAAVQSLEEAGEQLRFKLPITGDYKIGNTWAETH